MAATHALRSLLKKRSLTCNEPSMLMRRLVSSQPAHVDSSSFAQRLRDLPKDLPATNIKKDVSQVISLYVFPQFLLFFILCHFFLCFCFLLFQVLFFTFSILSLSSPPPPPISSLFLLCHNNFLREINKSLFIIFSNAQESSGVFIIVY